MQAGIQRAAEPPSSRRHHADSQDVLLNDRVSKTSLATRLVGVPETDSLTIVPQCHAPWTLEHLRESRVPGSRQLVCPWEAGRPGLRTQAGLLCLSLHTAVPRGMVLTS